MDELNKSQEGECRRCGRCCQQPFSHQVSPDDLKRWEQEQRFDLISAEAEEKKALDGEEGVRAWRRYRPCRFLKTGGDGRTTCDTYHTRPQVCRTFIPGVSRLCPAKEQARD